MACSSEAPLAAVVAMAVCRGRQDEISIIKRVLWRRWRGVDEDRRWSRAEARRQGVWGEGGFGLAWARVGLRAFFHPCSFCW